MSQHDVCELLYSNTTGNLDAILRLNDRKVHEYIPVLIYISVGMVIGTVGNAAVCYVYSRKMERTGTNQFVVMLGACDFLSCVFSMPMELFRVSTPHIFQSHEACKLSLLIATAIAVDSGFIIFAISIDRYRRMCRPFDTQLTPKMAKRVSAAIIVTSLVFVWPSWIIYGMRRTPTHSNETTGGCECGIDQVMFDTIYPRLFYYILLTLSVLLFSIIFLLYFLIAIKVWRHKNKRRPNSATLPSVGLAKDGKGTGNSILKIPYPPTLESEVSIDSSRTRLKLDRSKRTRKQKQQLQQPEKSSKGSLLRVSRTSSIMALIAVTWVLSYMPHVILVMLEIHIKEFRQELSSTGDVLFQLAVRSYLLNNAVNPIIYGVFNMRFRRELGRLVGFILPPCSRSNMPVTQPSSQMCSQPSMDEWRKKSLRIIRHPFCVIYFQSPKPTIFRTNHWLFVFFNHSEWDIFKARQHRSWSKSKIFLVIRKIIEKRE